MIIVELYKNLLNGMDLSNITYWMDVMLCSGVCVAYLIDCLIMFVIISILIKLCTRRSIFYWIKKII